MFLLFNIHHPRWFSAVNGIPVTVGLFLAHLYLLFGLAPDQLVFDNRWLVDHLHLPLRRSNIKAGTIIAPPESPPPQLGWPRVSLCFAAPRCQAPSRQAPGALGIGLHPLQGPYQGALPGGRPLTGASPLRSTPARAPGRRRARSTPRQAAPWPHEIRTAAARGREKPVQRRLGPRLGVRAVRGPTHEAELQPRRVLRHSSPLDSVSGRLEMATGRLLVAGPMVVTSL